MTASIDIVEVVDALAWPLVALVAVVLLRGPLGGLVTEVGRRATKVSVFNVAVELSTVAPLETTWKMGSHDVRHLARADVFDSAALSLFQELEDAGASDYIVVHLGQGDQWLTSRLFVFALLLRRMRGLRCVVFTGPKGDETHAFVALADPVRLRWSLAGAYPWLEAAYAQAYAALPPQVGKDGRLPATDAVNLARGFLERIQANPPAVPDQWVELSPSAPGQPSTWEHTTWVTTTVLEGLLGKSALDGSLAVTDSPDTAAEDRARAVARRHGDFVALVTPTGRFTALVDRVNVLDAIARPAVEAKSKDT